MEGLSAALTKVPEGKRGNLTVGASLTGAEVSVGWRPRPGFTMAGYGVGLWRGGWQAGVKGTVVW